jgi:hypothetical protein
LYTYRVVSFFTFVLVNLVVGDGDCFGRVEKYFLI